MPMRRSETGKPYVDGKKSDGSMITKKEDMIQCLVEKYPLDCPPPPHTGNDATSAPGV